jgi:type I restriction-modification system DNA methylase subunit
VFKPYAAIGTNLLFFEKGEPTRDIWFYEHRVPAYSMAKPIRFEHLQGCIDWWGGPKRKGREETPQAWSVTAQEVKARGYNLAGVRSSTTRLCEYCTEYYCVCKPTLFWVSHPASKRRCPSETETEHMQRPKSVQSTQPGRMP